MVAMAGYSPVASDAEATTFQDYLPFIRMKAYQFNQQFLTDVEELESHANWIFHRAWITWSPEKGRFKSWLSFLLWKIWLEHVRRAAQRQARLPRESMDLSRMVAPVHADAENWLTDLMEELSDDARFLVQITLDTPAEVKKFIRYSTPRSVIEGLERFLSKIGWKQRRITKAFTEVRRKL